MSLQIIQVIALVRLALKKNGYTLSVGQNAVIQALVIKS